MLKVIEYKSVWVWKRGEPFRVLRPVYEDVGKGAGLEKKADLKKKKVKQRKLYY